VLSRTRPEEGSIGRRQLNLSVEWRHARLLLLLGVTLLAAFYRLHRIQSLPPGDRYAPAFYGVDALRVLSGERPIFFYDYAGQHRVEPLFSYLVALSFLVVGPSTLGIHLASALVGVLTVPAVYVAVDPQALAEACPDRSIGVV
jgi:4-amino-4-deoxy-L-arabinose transferase-like glycosyltransferase